MNALGLFSRLPSPLRLLALGAHCDDIEIGCGGTILRLLRERPDTEVCWAVFCSNAERAAEARSSAAAFLEGAVAAQVLIHDFRDGFLPYLGAEVKDAFEALKCRFNPSLILAPAREDRHQDHRLVSDLAWNTFRDHLLLEYEIPKWDGDFGNPNVFVHLPRAILDRKVELLVTHFPSQAGRHWFTPDLFHSVARIRGMESVAPDQLAEAFTARKLVLA